MAVFPMTTLLSIYIFFAGTKIDVCRKLNSAILFFFIEQAKIRTKMKVLELKTPDSEWSVKYITNFNTEEF